MRHPKEKNHSTASNCFNLNLQKPLHKNNVHLQKVLNTKLGQV